MNDWARHPCVNPDLGVPNTLNTTIEGVGEFGKAHCTEIEIKRTSDRLVLAKLVYLSKIER
jgi:hypothetical protein